MNTRDFSKDIEAYKERVAASKKVFKVFDDNAHLFSKEDIAVVRRYREALSEMLEATIALRDQLENMILRLGVGDVS